MSRQHQHNCFNKTEIRIVLKSFLTLTARKNCFYSSVWETKTFIGIVIFWVGGKNCIVRNEKCIVFPESRYVNSNPGIWAAFYEDFLNCFLLESISKRRPQQSKKKRIRRCTYLNVEQPETTWNQLKWPETTQKQSGISLNHPEINLNHLKLAILQYLLAYFNSYSLIVFDFNSLTSTVFFLANAVALLFAWFCRDINIILI